MTASDDYHILGDFVMNILIVAVLRRTTAGRSSEGLVHSNNIVILAALPYVFLIITPGLSVVRSRGFWSPNQQNHQQFCSATMLCSAVVSLFLPFLFFLTVF